MSPPHVRRVRLRACLVTAALAALSGCGTEPADGSATVYRLAAMDGVRGTSLSCFASYIQYAGGTSVRSGDCAVALLSLEVRFDSTGPAPTLVTTARVVQDGEAATWQVAVPTTIRNNTIQYDFGTVAAPLTAQQVFVLPWAGTVVDGVLTLRMANAFSTGEPDRTDYFRLHPTVFILTPSGQPPRVTRPARRYTGFAFDGLPTDYCTEDAPGLPARCFHTSFSLTATADSGTVDYQSAVRWQTDTLASQFESRARVRVAHTNAYVQLVSPDTPSVLVPRAFEAEGSVIGDVLTLFIRTEGYASPIVARAE
jgi:hypothetical protein